MRSWLFTAAFLGVLACGDGNEADNVGVGGECTSAADCPERDDTDLDPLECLTEFTGGYCGLSGCESDEDCPTGSLCVTEGSTNYCFLICLEKEDCNTNRSEANEANCNGSGTVDYVNTANDDKVCVPPSGS